MALQSANAAAFTADELANPCTDPCRLGDAWHCFEAYIEKALEIRFSALSVRMALRGRELEKKESVGESLM